MAVSDSSKGQFDYVKTMLPPFSIDPHVVTPSSDMYMFYCNNDYQVESTGTRLMCGRMIAPFTMEGSTRCIVCPTLDEEIYLWDRFRKGKQWHTVESAFYFYHEGIHFLMYSGA